MIRTRKSGRPLRLASSIVAVAALMGLGVAADRLVLGSGPSSPPSIEEEHTASGRADAQESSHAHGEAETDHETSGHAVGEGEDGDSGASASGQEGAGAATDAAVRVHLSDQALANIGLTTEVIVPREVERTIRFPGVIRMHPDGVASVSTRIQGKIVSANVAPGSEVRKGQLLARIQSLVPGNPPPIVDVRAPIAGIVAMRDAYVGEAVQPNKELFRLVDPRHVVAEALVPERVVDQVGLNQRAHVHRLRDHGRWTGKVTFVGSEADPSTRTYPVWIEFSGREKALPRPGQYVDVLLIQSALMALAVPQAAIVEEGALRYVFVKRGEEFEHRLVTTGVEDSRSVEIISGLAAGDTVAVSGSYELALALGGSVATGENIPHEH